MRTLAKGNQEEDYYEDDDFGARKEGPSSISNTKDAKNNEKASAIRSKHSVTEQRRRSKINERFQILRDLVPHSEQKRDTASFLLEVIDYVQYLQEKVQKYEGSSYQGWNSEPTKLIPWRNSHWRVQGFVGHHQAAKNGTGSPFPGKLDENIVSVVQTTQSPVESDPSREDGVSKGIRLPLSTPASISGRSPVPLATTASISDAGGIPLPFGTSASAFGPGRSDCVLAHPLQMPLMDSQSTQQDELAIEGGTISIKSTYTQGLLNTISQALQSAGLDLSQASISVQIDLGKRAKKLPDPGKMPVSMDYENPQTSIQKIRHYRDTGSGEDSDRAQKRVKS